MTEDFPCKTCGHRNKMHVSLDDAATYNNHKGRMCIEYQDAIDVRGIWCHNKEKICRCNDFVPDNLGYLEKQHEQSIK